MDTLETRLAARPRHISPEEWAVRVDLAACYRLIAHFGWDDLILTHNSARVPGTTDQMLINPMGLMFNEITASSLLKVDITDGHLIEPSEYEPINAGIVIHGAIYLARPDVECVVVQQSHGTLSATAMTPAAAESAIREAVPRALERVAKLKPFVVKPPIEIEIDFKHRLPAELLDYTPWFNRRGASTIGFQAASVCEAYRVMMFLYNYNIALS